jgi:hypothetical protein
VSAPVTNLTPHPITLLGKRTVNIEPAGTVARIAARESPAGHLNIGDLPVPLWGRRTGQMVGLPPAIYGQWLVVSRVVALGAPERTDLLVPHHLVRDHDGTVVGCAGFARIRPERTASCPAP